MKKRKHNLAGHTALITGATSGMGLEYSRQLAALGCDLLMVSNQREALQKIPQEIAQQYHVHAIGHYQDLAQDDAAQSLYDHCISQGIQVDILINNAGIYFFDELTPELQPKVEAMLRLHVLTPTRLSILFGNDMKARRSGYILNVSSLAAKLPTPGITLYSATKAYLKSFTKSLYFEMRPYGVGVTTVLPGAIATPLYGLNPKLMSFAVKIGLIHTPKWLVQRAIRGMLRHHHVVKPGAMNYYLPPIIKLLPNSLETCIWNKLKPKKKE